MNKKYTLPAAASLLIVAMMLTSLIPAMATVANSSALRTTVTKALPVLEVRSIAEDD